MATTIVTPEKKAIITEIEIAAPPERVFQALTKPEQLMRWWTDEDCKAEVWRFEPRPGEWWSARLRSETTSINGFNTFEPNGKILECDPPRVLAYTWTCNWDPYPAITTVVRWELSPSPRGTQVKLTHSELTPELAEDYRNGWPSVLGKLKSFVE
jgi:uncharacterized protein YndB with AHSA1/START domain